MLSSGPYLPSRGRRVYAMSGDPMVPNEWGATENMPDLWSYEKRMNKNLEESRRVYQTDGGPKQRSRSLSNLTRRSIKGIKGALGIKKESGSYTLPEVTTDKDVTDVREVEVFEAPAGTFPTFESDGSMPSGPNSLGLEDFNPLKQDMTSIVAEYTVKVGQELPLKGFDPKRYKALSRGLVPNHLFPLNTVYVLKTKDPKEQAYPMYVLPPGYFRELLPMAPYFRQCPLIGHTLINGAEWRKFDIQPGFFYRGGNIYHLPGGWLLTTYHIKLCHVMSSYERELQAGRDTLHEFSDSADYKVTLSSAENVSGKTVSKN